MRNNRYFCQMKFLWFVLSIYMFALIVMPCNDGKASDKMLHCCGSDSQKTDDTHKDQNQTHQSCSPFCTCSCCNANALSVSYFPNLTYLSQEIDNHFITEPSAITKVAIPVWQPPKSFFIV